jgi:hypothetical protein
MCGGVVRRYVSVRFINATSRRSKHCIARVDERLDAAIIAAAEYAEETWMLVCNAHTK